MVLDGFKKIWDSFFKLQLERKIHYYLKCGVWCIYLVCVCAFMCGTVCMSMVVHTHTHMPWKEQLSEVISLLPPYGIQGSKPGL